MLTDEGLLMSRIVTGITRTQLETGTFQILLERGLAKIGCYFTNQTSEEFRVTSVTFSGLSLQGTVFPESVIVVFFFKSGLNASGRNSDTHTGTPLLYPRR